jgi:hypothetical protein
VRIVVCIDCLLLLPSAICPSAVVFSIVLTEIVTVKEI